MADLEQARALARQDCPLPALAGPALKVLVERIDFLEGAMRAAAATLEGDADEHGVASALRLALGENPRLIGIDRSSDDDVTSMCAARQDHAGKTRWVKLGEAIEWDGGSITLDLDTLPAGPWWDGKLRLFVQSERKPGGRGGDAP